MLSFAYYIDIVFCHEYGSDWTVGALSEWQGLRAWNNPAKLMDCSVQYDCVPQA